MCGRQWKRKPAANERVLQPRLRGEIPLRAAQRVDGFFLPHIGPHAELPVFMHHAGTAERGLRKQIPGHAAQAVIGGQKVVAPQMGCFNVVLEFRQFALIAEAGQGQLVIRVGMDRFVADARLVALNGAFHHQLAAFIPQAIGQQGGMPPRGADIFRQHVEALFNRQRLMKIGNQSQFRVHKYAHFIRDGQLFFRRHMGMITIKIEAVIL